METKYKLLVVEDEDSQRELYKEYFTMQNFEVITAADGEEALRLINANVYVDLILLDLMLPKIDGMRVLEQIKNNPQTKDIIVYLMTVLGTDAMVKNAFAKGANGYIIKDSMTPEQIKNEILGAIEKKKISTN